MGDRAHTSTLQINRYIEDEELHLAGQCTMKESGMSVDRYAERGKPKTTAENTVKDIKH